MNNSTFSSTLASTLLTVTASSAAASALGTPPYGTNSSGNVPSTLLSVKSTSTLSTGVAMAPSGKNCKNPKTGLDRACWDILNLSAYVENWMRTTGAELCTGDISFATCFQQSLNVVGQDCTGIRHTTCTPPTNSYSPEDYYVLYNIYAINQFFNSFWTALNSANTLASEVMQKMINTISPPESTNVALQAVLVCLAVAFAFIDLPLVFALTGAELVAVTVLTTAVQQTPGVMRFLFPSKTEEPAEIQMSQMSNELAKIVMKFQENMSKAVGAIENNSTAFTIWASTGLFSGKLADLNSQQHSLYQTLNTFVASQALRANDVILTVGMDTDVQQLQANSSERLTYDIKCPHYDEFGVCNAWWHDNKTNIAYALNDRKALLHNFNKEMRTIFSEGWTTAEQLFAGAQQCKQSADYLQRGPTVSFDGGRPSFACVSGLEVCTWDVHCRWGERCEFTDCETQDNFSLNGCFSGPTFHPMLPPGYLGFYLTECKKKMGSW
ncbi:MAG: hypothetical protein M1832_001387 [Thelocarpon impressellum]|nr:MAG: hypothetical protein M1832_001387 [Thelocarpon impressellum]